MMLVLSLMAAAVIFSVGLFGAINSMDHATRHGIRLAWFALTTGALAILLGPLYGYTQPAWSEVLLNVGTALFLSIDRRRAGERKPR